MGKNKFKTSSLPDNGLFKSTEVKNEVNTVVFSFKFFDFNNDCFCFSHKEYNYFECLIDRLRNLSTMTAKELLSCRGHSLRCHPINWQNTSQKNGFSNLNEQFKSYPAYQFSLSTNEHGRVHGFFMGDIFHIVWFDPEHKLYP